MHGSWSLHYLGINSAMLDIDADPASVKAVIEVCAAFSRGGECY
jgi:hypothetical protein